MRVDVDPGAAIDALASAVAGLLTAPADAALKPQVSILPSATSLAGVGGFIGYSDDPPAERRARRVEGVIVVRVLAASEAGLHAAEAQASRDLIAADPAQLRRSGILRLRRLVDAAATPPAPPVAPTFRDLQFAVHFEHAPLPTAPEARVAAVRSDVMLASAGGALRYETEFLADPLADFTAVAGAGSGSAPAWAFDAADLELRQTGTLAGGADGMSGDKTGAYLLLNSGPAGGPLTDCLVEAEMRSDGPGGLGLVFNYRDRGNFAFALLEQPPGIRLFGRRAAGVGAQLAEGGQDETAGFAQGAWLRLRLLVQDDRAELAIDETPVLAARDPKLRAAGQVGLFCRGGGNVRIRHFKVSSLQAEGR